MSALSLITRSLRGAIAPFWSTRSLENPNTQINDPEVMDWLGGEGSDTGEKITPNKMLSVAAVWQAINLISGDIAKLPLDLYRKGKDGERAKADDHPAHRMVRYSPNEEMNAFFFWRTVIVHKSLWSNAYIYREVDRAGRTTALLPLLPDRTKAIRRNKVLYYQTEVGGRMSDPIPSRQIIHLRGISLDGVSGCELVRFAKETAARSIAAGKFASKFFNNGARAGGILEIPEGRTKETRDKIEKGFDKQYSGKENWFKTIVLRDGAKFQQLTIAPNEGQMGETREGEVREVARFFNLAPSRLGLSDSVSYNSKAEDNQAYLDSTLSPHLIEIAQELNNKLLTDKERESGEYYFEHNTRALTQMNPKDRILMYNVMIRASMASPNECRALENMPKRADGRGDEFVLQTNLVSYDQNGEAKIVADQPSQADNNPKPADPPAAAKESKSAKTGPGISQETSAHSLAQRRFLFGLARAARHKTLKLHAFRQWLEGGLASFRAEAEAAGVTNFDSMLDLMNETQRSTPPTALASAIDTIVSAWEEAALKNEE